MLKQFRILLEAISLIKMVITSRTGLVEGIRRPIKRYSKSQQPSFLLTGLSRPASFSLRPFAGLYNPFSRNCSILCNHPADPGARHLLQHAKHSWASDHKGLMLPAELEAFRSGLLRDHDHPDDGVAPVSEDIYRRYATSDFDSRPVTPAPTLASRGSQKRRCLTPELSSYGLNSKENRPVLVLDLRRSQSQETLAMSVPADGKSRNEETLSKGSWSPRVEDSILESPQMAESPALTLNVSARNDSESDDGIKRRGKRRKRGGKKQGGSELEREFQGLKEPGETQVSTIGDASRRPSESALLPKQGSLNESAAAESDTPDIKPMNKTQEKRNYRSFLKSGIIKQLQRELDQEAIDAEFNEKRRIALEEANRARLALGVMYPPSPELKRFRKEMAATERSPEESEEVFRIPRTFSKQSARFELPLDTNCLASLTPIEYLSKFVCLPTGRKLLYTQVFKKHQDFDFEEQTMVEKNIKVEDLPAALAEVLGHQLTETEINEFHQIIGWKPEEPFIFRSWCGVAAAGERIFGSQFSPPSDNTTEKQDETHELEKADFETLPRKLCRLKERGLLPDPRLITLLLSIRNGYKQHTEFDDD